MTASDCERSVRLDCEDDGGRRYLTLGGVRGERSRLAGIRHATSPVAKGYTMSEIAQQLGLSRHTIADHIKQIYRKLVSSRAGSIRTCVVSERRPPPWRWP